MNADMELTNKSMVADVSDWKQPFDDAFCEKLLKIDGVKEIHKLNYSTIVVPWEPDFSDQWMRDFYDQWMYIKYDDVREEYQQNPEHFMALVVGIDEKHFIISISRMKRQSMRNHFGRGKLPFMPAIYGIYQCGCQK